ncbi:hypothetical protein RJ639_031289, partial [Escallonia herrerae]
MSDEGEKTCPLCAEEMDLTDQQLKPCKCGYEICVWCWHHIMDMAEKDDTEGRCPACRTPYNKEKIVGMAEKCERLVAEMSMERKVKSQKSKSKTSEGRKQLSSVRVIQRNLVYIMGLPLNLADEDLLQRKEYFCQYGRVMKVSISRTTTGAIQHFANNTCSVYITYSKEEEAVRCIQSVHGFTLDGRPLRACFGTTKYCHAWLRNVPCSNPDCLYLHEIGSQEDSFTKDEIISAYTRNRVQQITGATIDMQRRSGNMLPPPTDEYCYNSSDSLGKPICKSSTNNPTNGVRGSPPDGSPCRSVGLPAAASWYTINWSAVPSETLDVFVLALTILMITRGIRASNSQPPSSSIACSNGSFKHKPETPSESLAFLTGSRGQVSILHGDTGKKAKEESHITQHICKLEPLETVKHYINSDNRRTASEAPLTPGLPATSISNSLTRTPAYKDKEKPIRAPPSLTSSIGLSGRAGGPGPEKVLSVAAEGKIQNLSSDMSLMSLDRHQVEQQSSAEKFKGHLVSRAAGNGATSVEDCCVTREQSDLRSDPQPQVAKVALPEVEEDILSFEVQRLKDPEVISQASFIPILSQSLHLSNDSRGYSPQLAYGSLKVNIDSQGVDKILNKGSVSIPAISNGYPENLASSSSDFDSTVQHSFLIPNDGGWKHASRFEDKVMEVDRNASVDMGESSIISNILSMDFDSWDESLTSPQNFAKLLGETDKQQGSLGASSSWKAQSNSQSRFSFAREEEYVNQVSHADSYSSNVGQFLKNHSLSHNFVNNGEFYTEKLANGFSSFNVEEPENFAGSSHSHMSSNKLS